MRGYQAVVGALCKQERFPAPVAEYQFAPPRKWAFDLAWIPERVALEIQGGLFVQGRHAQAAALLKEYEKLNAANIAGWCVLLVTPQQVMDGTLQALLAQLWPHYRGHGVPRRVWEDV